MNSSASVEGLQHLRIWVFFIAISSRYFRSLPHLGTMSAQPDQASDKSVPDGGEDAEMFSNEGDAAMQRFKEDGRDGS